MACACKVNKDLEYLHKHYGNKTDVSKKEIREFRFREFLKQLITYIVGIIFLPIIFLYVFIHLFKKDKVIKIRKNKWLIPIKV